MTDLELIDRKWQRKSIFDIKAKTEVCQNQKLSEFSREDGGWSVGAVSPARANRGAREPSDETEKLKHSLH
jgi:hypothetical protein